MRRASLWAGWIVLAFALGGSAYAVETIEHTVEPGDTLWSIAAKADVYADPKLWPLIYKSNRDQIVSPEQIYPDQRLIIPLSVDEKLVLEAVDRVDAPRSRRPGGEPTLLRPR